MAVPFLPDPDVLLPADADPVDSGQQLVMLGFDRVGGPVDVGELVEAIVAADDHTAAAGGPPRWTIDDEGVAEWAMAKLAEARANLAALDRQRAGYERRIDGWHDRASEAVRRDAAFFEAHLTLWALSIRSQTKAATKTALLPSGEIRTRKPGPWKPAIDDPQVLLEWAIGLRDSGRNIVRSRLILDVMVAALGTVAVCVATDDGDMVVVDRETGERIPGTRAGRTESQPTVVTYETD